MYGDLLRHHLLVDLTIMLLIDDAIRKNWIYCIQNKSNVFYTFKKWKTLVENEIGNKLKYLR
jgi:hypothetical protein